MTISNTANYITASGDGLTVTFNYDFPMGGSATNARLILIDSGDNESEVPSDEFSVTGVTSSSGGTFTYPISGTPVTAGITLALYRVLPLTQPAAVGNQGNFYPAVVEGALDREVMLVQQQVPTGGDGTLFLSGNPTEIEGQFRQIQLGSGLSFSGNSLVVTGGGGGTGSGTVTSVATSGGLTGGPITGVGTISIAPAGVTYSNIQTVTNARVLGNYSGATASVREIQISAGLNVTLVATTTSLTISASNTGSGITSLATGTGLFGGPITTTGTVAITTSGVTTGLINSAAVTYAKIQAVAASSLVGNPTTASTTASEITLGSGLSFSGTTLVAQVGTGTVTSVAAGTGLAGGTITDSGTLALAAIADQRFMANYSGGSLAPQAVEIVAGANITFSGTTTSFTISASTGTGSGITSLICGTGLSGGTITSSGTVAIAPITTGLIFANYSGGALAPQGVTLVAGANITFAGTTTSLTISASTGTGSGITSLVCGTGLSGGTITTSGTVAIDTITTGFIFANFSGGTAAPRGVLLNAGSGITFSAVTASMTISTTTTLTGAVTGTGAGSITTAQVGTINFILDGGGATISTGVRGDLGPYDFPMTLSAYTALADQTGSISVSLWMDTYANYPPTVADTIVGLNYIAITSSIKSQDTVLTSWTTSIPAGRTLRVNVQSVASITRLGIALKYTR